MIGATLEDYMSVVRTDAKKFMTDSFDQFDSFDVMFDCMMNQPSVVGFVYNKCGSFDKACALVSTIVFDQRFHREFKEIFGREPKMGAPYAFDTDIRRYVLQMLKRELKDEYEVIAFCHEFKIVEGFEVEE
jgi:hypothetical protein|nr:MAG TPA_asm: hypothetical protein [Caudoviricetes sp.]